ncbi:MAG: type II secretion system protein GspG [Planctomycetes bacterium]|nr:type II secretion system protein GspG [Planctomycetota bacterium]
MILSPVRRRLEGRRRNAFTLLEVLIVVAIVVVLAGVSSIYVFQYLEDSKVSAAKASCRTLAETVERYVVQKEELPQQLTDIRPYIKETSTDPFLDPWGQPYQMRVQEINGKPTPVVFTKTKEGIEISNLTK